MFPSPTTLVRLFMALIMPVLSILAERYVANLSIQPVLFSSGTTASLPASPITDNVGELTKPPLARYSICVKLTSFNDIP